MRCSASPGSGSDNHARAASAVRLAAVLAAALALWAGPSPGASSGPAPGFRVVEASTRLVDGVVVLDARIDLRFSPETLEAMENGVPLTVSVEIDVLRERRLRDKRVAHLVARYRIETHALTGQYVITNLNSGALRNFASFEAMRVALGTISDFPVLDDYLLEDERVYTLRLRALLEIEALPAPMRPLAYLSRRWRLKSDWYEWPFSR